MIEPLDRDRDEILDICKSHLAAFVNNTQDARELSERDRDYIDHRQWTSEQEATLNARGQSAIIDNRVKPKKEGLKGLIMGRNTQPKAYSRNQRDEKSSEVITDGFKYVQDASDFDTTKADVLDNLIVEGYGGVIIDVQESREGVDIIPTLIPWDRIYFDPHSRRQDFKDAMYIGVANWMNLDAAITMFPDKEELLQQELHAHNSLDETFDDRPRFGMISADRNRIMIAQEYFLQRGTWYLCMFAGNSYLIEPMPSPFTDEDGKPMNPIELVHAYIDRDNNRYGEVRTWIDQQDMINHRQSKFLHLMSTRQTFSTLASGIDVEEMKRELKKPDGHIELESGEFGKDFGVIPTGDMADAQFQLLEMAKQSLDAVSFNAQLSGERGGNLSGKAVNSLQQAGMLEVNGLHTAFVGWQKRVFRQVWCRMKQFWTEEKWIRVTDDFDKLKWIGINVPVTTQEFLEDKVNDTSLPRPERQKAAMMLQQMVQMQDPRLGEFITTKNPVPRLDMDVIIDQGPDSINVQQEQFQQLMELAAARPDIPLKALLKMSSLRNKDDLISEIDKGQEAANQAQAAVAQLEQADRTVTIQGKQVNNLLTQAKIAETEARTTDIQMDSISSQMANTNLAMTPDKNPQATVTT